MSRCFSVLLAMLIFSPWAVASNYPSDMPIWSDSQTMDGAHIERQMQGSGAVALNIKYTGSLANSSGVSVLIMINYYDGQRQLLIPMNNFGSHWEVRVTNGCLIGMLGGCEQYGTDEMRELLYWASWQRPGKMFLNRLSVGLAFVNDNGQWDSRDGRNFSFDFPGYER